MSDSELSDAPSNDLPPDNEIESVLRQETVKAAQGPLEEYTVSRIRKAAENALNLSEGFLKSDAEWKSRSKAIIDAQVEKNEAGAEPEPESKPKSSKRGLKENQSKATVPAKRASLPEKPRPKKKQKVDSDDETSALSSPPDDLSGEEEGQQSKVSKPSTRGKKDPAKGLGPQGKSRSKSEPKKQTKEQTPVKSDESENEQVKSDSEMSVVLDEGPIPKKRGKGKTTSTTSTSKTSKSKPQASGNGDADVDQEEIKRLQSWLVKCGIRKVWGKELKPFDTSKAKIKHLRGMLSDAGMTGRYSNEKAAQIKEARELAADIEAVQEGNERWGKSGDEGGGDGDVDGDLKTRTGRRLVRGAKNYDFLSSDGEETD